MSRKQAPVEVPVSRYVPESAQELREILAAAADAGIVRVSDSANGTTFVREAKPRRASKPRRAASKPEASKPEASKPEASKPEARNVSADSVLLGVRSDDGRKVQYSGTRADGAFTFGWVTTVGTEPLARSVVVIRDRVNASGHAQYSGGVAKHGGYVKIGLRADPGARVNALRVDLQRVGDRILITAPRTVTRAERRARVA